MTALSSWKPASSTTVGSKTVAMFGHF
jgi:hypothetical protein